MQQKKKERGNYFTSLINFLSSLKLTIPLLIVLAALSVIGTFVTQNATEAEYLQRYSKEVYYIFKVLGIFNIYHSLWFIGVLILLVINLIACSWKRLPGVWQQVRKAKSGYARLGTYLTHLSVLLILIGGLIGALWGFKGYVQILEGETVEEMGEILRVSYSCWILPLGIPTQEMPRWTELFGAPPSELASVNVSYFGSKSYSGDGTIWALCAGRWRFVAVVARSILS